MAVNRSLGARAADAAELDPEALAAPFLQARQAENMASAAAAIAGAEAHRTRRERSPKLTPANNLSDPLAFNFGDDFDEVTEWGDECVLTLGGWILHNPNEQFRASLPLQLARNFGAMSAERRVENPQTAGLGDDFIPLTN